MGSSRSKGATKEAIDLVFPGSLCQKRDLNDYEISYFDYEHKNKDDDFLPLIKEVLEHDTLVLATPVYWYTMSAQMKTFLDRISDLLIFHKDLGRQLRGKELAVITSYQNPQLEGFECPFYQTAEYLGMTYKGCLYFYSGSDPELLAKNESLAKAFGTQFQDAAPLC